MAIEQTSTVTDRTLFAGQHLDRLSAVPWVQANFVRVEPTGETGAYGLPTYKKHPECWRYSIRVEDPTQVIALQAFALELIVGEAFVEAGITKTAEEVTALVTAMMNRGITFDHAQTQAWEDLEAKRRAGEVLPIIFEVTEGKKYMEALGLPTG